MKNEECKIQKISKDILNSFFAKEKEPFLDLIPPEPKNDFYESPTHKINQLISVYKIFSKIVESPHFFLVSTDVFANILDVSKSSFEILGFQREQIIGCNVYDLIHLDDHKYYKENYPSVLKEQENQMIDIRFKTKKDEYKWMRVLIFVLQEEEEEHSYIFGTEIKTNFRKEKE